MNCQYKTSLIRLILAFLGLLLLIYVLGNLGCAYIQEHNPQIRPDNVSETVVPIYNKGHLPMGDFLIKVGNEINHIESYLNVKVYKITIEVGQTLTRDYEIKIAWIYYD